MCIYFLSSECPTAGLNASMSSSMLYDPSRRAPTEEASSSTQSIMSSRSSVTTISSQSNASSESLYELGTEENTSLNTASSIKNFRNTASSESGNYSTNTTADASTFNDYITAVNTLANMLENKSGIEVGLCLDPTSPVPSQCRNFQIRHRSSSKRQTGYFDKCVLCTKIGKHRQESQEDQDVTLENLSQTSSRGQKVNKAETGMCSTKGCEGCRPAQS